MEEIKIPPSLPEILKEYAKHIIKTNPADVLVASLEYFSRLSIHNASKTDTLSLLQLESFYNKFHASGRELQLVLSTEIQSASVEIGMTVLQVQDILALGKWTDKCPWLRFWALMVASTSGTLVSTIRAACQICGDGKQGVPLLVIRDVVLFLLRNDATVTSEDQRKIGEMLDLDVDCVDVDWLVLNVQNSFVLAVAPVDIGVVSSESNLQTVEPVMEDVPSIEVSAHETISVQEPEHNDEGINDIENDQIDD